MDTLGLKSGDELEVVSAQPTRLAVTKDKRRERAIDRMRRRALDLPDGYSFDRNEASAR